MPRPKTLTPKRLAEAFTYYLSLGTIEKAAEAIGCSSTALYACPETKGWLQLKQQFMADSRRMAANQVQDAVAERIDEFADNLGKGMSALGKQFLEKAEKGESDIAELNQLTQIAERLSKITSKVSPDQGKQRYEFEVKLSAPKPAEPMKQVFDASQSELVNSTCVRDMQVVVTSTTDSDKI